jgi:hypothetical protein
MRGIAASILVFEGLVVMFATLVALDLSDIEDGTLWAIGGTVAVLCVLSAGLLGRRWGYLVGSAVQLLVIAAGFVEPAMFFMGVVFAGLWFLALHLGRKVERIQRQAQSGS